MTLPSRFQLGDWAKVGRRMGRVVGVTFALISDEEGGELAKIFYDVEGVGRVISDQIQAAPRLVEVTGPNGEPYPTSLVGANITGGRDV